MARREDDTTGWAEVWEVYNVNTDAGIWVFPTKAEAIKRRDHAQRMARIQADRIGHAYNIRLDVRRVR